MAETSVHFRQWLFLVGKQATGAAYPASLASVPMTCGCSECRNFEAARETAFPPEALALFAEPGVDYRREGEVYANTLVPGRHLYGGWFYFKRTITAGPDLRSTTENNQAQLTDLFSLAFTTGHAPGSFADLRRTVQIEI